MTTADVQTVRELVQTSSGLPASDGAGVQLTRIIGTPDIDFVDPFLLLDAFESDRPGDYIGGFPDHPHRGFETVTYLLAGRMRHKDNAGHEGVIEPGGVQWMTAGRGIVHSEMPEQDNGLLQGFQLWVNLPAAEKMTAPGYQGFAPPVIPIDSLEAGGEIKVIAGKTDAGTAGPVKSATVAPLFLDVSLGQHGDFTQRVPDTHSAIVYVIDGRVRIGAERRELPARSLGILGAGDRVDIATGNAPSRFLLIAGRRLNEPVARGGPFVMNTKQEVLQAFQDYQSGRF